MVGEKTICAPKPAICGKPVEISRRFLYDKEEAAIRSAVKLELENSNFPKRNPKIAELE